MCTGQTHREHFTTRYQSYTFLPPTFPPAAHRSTLNQDTAGHWIDAHTADRNPLALSPHYRAAKPPPSRGPRG